jgi:hypothetical protein
MRRWLKLRRYRPIIQLRRRFVFDEAVKRKRKVFSGFSSLVDWYKRKIASADIFGAGADEFVVCVLLEDMTGPA